MGPDFGSRRGENGRWTDVWRKWMKCGWMKMVWGPRCKQLGTHEKDQMPHIVNVKHPEAASNLAPCQTRFGWGGTSPTFFPRCLAECLRPNLCPGLFCRSVHLPNSTPARPPALYYYYCLASLSSSTNGGGVNF